MAAGSSRHIEPLLPAEAVETATVTDDFNRGSLGSNWSVIAPGDSPLTISGNALVCASEGTHQTGYWNVQSFDADQEASITLVDFPSPNNLRGVWLYLRLQDPGTSGRDGYRFQFIRDSTSGTVDYWGIEVITNGSSAGFPAFGSTPSKYQDGDKIRASVVGDLLTQERWRAGVWTELGTATDSTYTSGGYIGVDHDDGGTLDDFIGPEVVVTTGLVWRTGLGMKKPIVYANA